MSLSHNKALEKNEYLHFQDIQFVRPVPSVASVVEPPLMILLIIVQCSCQMPPEVNSNYFAYFTNNQWGRSQIKQIFGNKCEQFKMFG